MMTIESGKLPAVLLLALGMVSCSNSGPAPQSTVTSGAGAAAIPGTVPNAIPYTIEFQPVTLPANSLPALQAYCLAPAPSGGWYVAGGRITGLHTFTTSQQNFPPNLENPSLWWINPETLTATVLVDLTKLAPALRDPLMATNQQCYSDGTSWYIAGGYGNNSVTGKLGTFDSLMRIPLSAVAALASDNTSTAAQKNAAFAAQIETIHDPLFKVTGAVLLKTANFFVLAFGQVFDGNYNPFGTGSTQQYTQTVGFFTLKPGKLAISTKGSLGPNAEFHRRDLPMVNSIDPSNGTPRLAGFAGVFPDGKIAGLTDVVYIKEQFGELQTSVDTNLNKHFSAYQCPTVPVYDKVGKVIYYTFFGGIGHYWYFQSDSQHQVYEAATAQGRNDGLPFTEDISTVIEKADGSYQEYFSPSPISGNMLHGASVDFIPAGGSKFMPGGIVDLSTFSAGEKALVGYVYGGIEAVNPLPVEPNTGTVPTNALYKVFLTLTPSSGVPASMAHEAVGISNHQQDSGTAK